MDHEPESQCQYGLSATDSCRLQGGGPGGIITSTLIAFAPGELSTLALPLNEWEMDFSLI